MDERWRHYGLLLGAADQQLDAARRTATEAGERAHGLGIDRGAHVNLRAELQQAWLTGWDNATAAAVLRKAARLAAAGYEEACE